MESKFFLNLFSNISVLGLSVIMSVWMTPFIIHTLGPEAFGFIPLTQNFINYLSVVTVILSSMVGRYFTVAVKRHEYDDAQAYIVTFIVSAIVMSCALIVPLVFLSFFIEKVVRVPPQLISDVRISMLIGCLLFVCTFVGASFSAVPFSMNRLYITNIIQLVNTLVRTIGTLVLLTQFRPHIWYVNLAALLGGIASFILEFYVLKKLMPTLRIRRRYFELKKLIELAASGIWNSVGQVGILLFLQIDLVIANIILGASATGQYAAISQFPGLLRVMASSIAAVFAPLIVIHFAENSMDKLKEHSNKSVRLNGLVISLPVALLCGFGKELLKVWLGPDFTHLHWILVIQSLYLVLALGVMPLFNIAIAVNKVKVPALITIVFGVVNLGLAYTLTGPMRLGLYGIAVAGAISLLAKNFVFTPIYSAYITGQRLYVYYRGILSPVIATGFSIGICFILGKLIIIESWTSMIVCGTLVCGFHLIFVFVFLVTNSEKRFVYSRIRLLLLPVRMYFDRS